VFLRRKWVRFVHAAAAPARVNASYDSIIWNTWFTSYSEESVIKTPLGNHVVAAVHGGGIFVSPDRFERSYYADLNYSNTEGLTGQNAAKITEKEARDVLEGRLPDGSEIPVFPFGDFKSGITNLPMRYAVILDYELARKSENGYPTFDTLREDPNMIVRAGGVEPLWAYLDKVRDRHNTMSMGNWHPYNRIDPDQPQTRMVYLAGNKGGVDTEGKDQGLGWGYDAEYGMGGDASMVNMARYITVAPRNGKNCLRHLGFSG